MISEIEDAVNVSRPTGSLMSLATEDSEATGLTLERPFSRTQQNFNRQGSIRHHSSPKDTSPDIAHRFSRLDPKQVCETMVDRLSHDSNYKKNKHARKVMADSQTPNRLGKNIIFADIEFLNNQGAKRSAWQIQPTFALIAILQAWLPFFELRIARIYANILLAVLVGFLIRVHSRHS